MKKRLYVLLVVLLFSRAAHAQVVDFTRSFYNWYLEEERGVDDVLRQKKEVLSPELYKALKADRDAQKKSRYIVGLDFDPFLNAQDVASKYEVGAEIAKGGTYWVPVYGWWPGGKGHERPERHKKPDVTAEVKCQGAVCKFVNFHYDSQDDPTNENLIGVLENLKKDRAGYR